MKFSMSGVYNLIVFAVLIISAPALAENPVSNVCKIESLSQISTDQPAKTLFLFDIDDTLLDSFSMLGSKAWRRYIVEATKKIDADENWHDIFSYALAQKHPLKAVEEMTSSFVSKLQENGHVVCGLTSRERKLWYDMPKERLHLLIMGFRVFSRGILR